MPVISIIVCAISTLLFVGFAVVALWQLYLFLMASYNRWSSLVAAILFGGIAGITWYQLEQRILIFLDMIRNLWFK